MRTSGGRHVHRVVPDLSFVASGADRIAVASWAAPVPSDADAFLLCPGWGMEMEVSLRLCSTVARAVAAKGGAAALMHWPGMGESDGDAAAIDRLVPAATDVLADLRDRLPAWRWGILGVRLGAWVAIRMAEATAAAPLVLVDPIADPAAHVEDLARRSRRGSLGRADPGWAFGYPLPERVDLAAVTEFPPGAAVIRYREGSTPWPAEPGALVPGRFRGDASLPDTGLEQALLRWLARRARVAS